MKRRILALLSAMTLLFVGCFEDDSSSVSLSLDVRDGKTSVNTGEEVTFEAYASGVDDITLYWKVDGDVSDQQNDWISKGKSVFSTTFNSEGTHKVHVMAWSSTAEIVTKSKTIEVSKKDDNNGGDDTGDLDDTTNYYLHTGITASTFWAGENASGDNHNISNVPSAWDNKWGDNFGVEDYPYLDRDSDFLPTDSRFKGIENPYYFALPYNDYGDVAYDGKNTSLVADLEDNWHDEYSSSYGRNIVTIDNMISIGWTKRKPSITKIPWYSSNQNWDGKSIVKARWIRIKYGSSDWVYAQWADAGPYYYDDVNYVFGKSKPLNQKLNTQDFPHAGIDLSPSVMLALGVDLGWSGANIDNVSWQFVNEKDVPDGPWKRYVSTNATNWE